MIEVRKFKPTRTEIGMFYVYFTFANGDSLVINDGNETFKFLAVESNKIIVNVDTYEVVNTKDILVFESDNQFVRVPVGRLLTTSNLYDILDDFIELVLPDDEPQQPILNFNNDTVEIIARLEHENLLRLIDNALMNRNESEFMRLTMQLNGG